MHLKRAVEWQVGSKVYRIIAQGGYVEVLLPTGQIFQLSESEADTLIKGLCEVLPKLKANALENAGQPWDSKQDAALKQLWGAGWGLARLAWYFKRTPRAIEARAERLKLFRD